MNPRVSFMFEVTFVAGKFRHLRLFTRCPAWTCGPKVTLVVVVAPDGVLVNVIEEIPPAPEFAAQFAKSADV